MLGATLLAVGTGRLRESDAERIIRLVASVGPLPSLGKIRATELRPILASDKKARAGRVRWVLPRRVGSTRWGIEIPWRVVSRSFAALPAIARHAGLRAK